MLNLFLPARIDFNTRVYESFLVNTGEAILGILFILALSRQIDIRSTKLGSFFKYFGKISLIILIFHVPIQDYWGQKFQTVTGNQSLSIWLAFVMGVAGSVLIYELFIKFNPVASFWFGREAEQPQSKQVAAPVEAAPMDVPESEKVSVNQ